jgi:hypothetical protein
MEITGHRTDAMFRRYAIVNEEQKREALARAQDLPGCLSEPQNRRDLTRKGLNSPSWWRAPIYAKIGADENCSKRTSTTLLPWSKE